VAAKFIWNGNSKESFKDGARLHIGLPIKAILEDDAGQAVLAKHLGEVMDSPVFNRYSKYSLLEIAPRKAAPVNVMGYEGISRHLEIIKYFHEHPYFSTKTDKRWIH